MIIVDTYAGLANRMRTIISGVSMARTFNQELKVIWPVDSDLNCSFYSLFLPNKAFHVVPDSFSSWCLSRQKSKYFFLKNFSSLYSYIFSYNYKLYDCELSDRVWQPPLYRLTKEKIPDFKNAYIKTCNEFFLQNTKYSEVFIPSDEISTTIDKNVSFMSPYTVGLHIRQTDHADSITKTPMENFIKSMYQEINTNSKANFYLATDSQSVKNKIIEIFGKDRIIVSDGGLDRGSKVGMINAVVDLYSLSYCKKIYGSYGSSFSEVASNLNNAKLVNPI